MNVPEPREGADDSIPDTQYGMTSADYVEMLNADGTNLNGPHDDVLPTFPLMPTQATVKNPREME